MQIPAEFKPRDGRFGSGPSKVRLEALHALAASGTSLMGTSHRQEPVRQLVGSIQEKITELFSVPAGYEVVMGIGGTTAFFDTAVFSLIRRRSQHLVHGEFTAKFARAATDAPHLDDPHIIESEWNTHPVAEPQDDVDVYAWAHNETSTGVMNSVRRVDKNALVLIDATSGAGALEVNIAETDVYYFAPQKTFASDGGLWIAIMSPQAIDRAFEIKAEGRYIPAFLDLTAAIENSRKQQTYNTPAIATLFLIKEQLDWMLGNGGLNWATQRSADSAQRLYEWAESHTHLTPFVPNDADRSRAVATIDIEGIESSAITNVLRSNGIVDIDGYRGLGRNQFRIATFPTIEPDDITALTRCIDFVIDSLC